MVNAVPDVNDSTMCAVTAPYTVDCMVVTDM